MVPRPTDDPESRPPSDAAVADGQHPIESSRRPGPGASLLLAARRVDPEHPPGEREIASLATEVGLEPGEFEEIRRFLELVLDPEGSDPLLHCAGMACGLAGAADLGSELREILQHRGMRRPILSVHCLDHCNSGPNVALGRQLYCGGLQRVVTDPRPWWDPGTGTVAVEGEGNAGSGGAPPSGDTPARPPASRA